MWVKAGISLALGLACSFGSSAKQSDPSCKTVFSVVTEDQLGNLKQGLSEKQLNEIAKKLSKKYPGVCYVAPAPNVSLVFLVTISTATYHGTRTDVNTSKQDVPEHGTITDENSQQVGTYDGTVTQTTTTESTVPVQFDYPLALLSIEQAQPDGTYKVMQRFQRKGLCPAYAGLCLANRHPFEYLIEDGAKWIYAGGLNDPLQSVASPTVDEARNAELRARQEGERQLAEQEVAQKLEEQLPREWESPCSPDTKDCKPSLFKIWIIGDTLYETSDHMLPNVDISTSCNTKRAGQEWKGSCMYTMAWTTPPGKVCRVETSELVTAVSVAHIVGVSQGMEWAPLAATPTQCPVASSSRSGFEYSPKSQQ